MQVESLTDENARVLRTAEDGDDSEEAGLTVADRVRVLILCGAPGTGKTVVAWEVGHQLQALGIRHAVIDTDELDRIWRQPEAADALIEVTRENLRAVWRTFDRLGVRHLVMCGVMASIPLNRA